MGEEDIYGNRKAYQRFVDNLDRILDKPGSEPRSRKRKYYCRNRLNLGYFEKLHRHFESRDTSYIRRNKIFRHLVFITHATEKDLAKCGRDEVDSIVALGHQTNRSTESKRDFLGIIKWLWRVLLPETDSEGRVLDDVVPYPVRHVSRRVDKSKERRRNEKLTMEEYERIVGFFGSDPKMQAFVTLAVESLGRPQEICYTRINDLEIHENYAKVHISSHGKEGVKFLDCIESFPYMMKWFEVHPHQRDGDAFLFCAGSERQRPMHPASINKRLRTACEKLGIDKRITGYSLKRNGVTFCRLRGESDVDIQHKAGWTSTRQLKTYDLSTPEDTFRSRLVKQGLVAGEEEVRKRERRICVCGAVLGFADEICRTCKRLADTKRIREDRKAEEEIRQVFALALREPDRSLAEILGEWRNRHVRLPR